MKPILKSIWFYFVLIFFLALPFEAGAGKATFYLFRHAEKITTDINETDPGLTEKGRLRATWLADYLEDKGVTRIFSSDTVRTLETVADLSAQLGISVEIYDPGTLEQATTMFKTLEGVIVVVGHSNTTPELAKLISGQDTNYMPESEYDRFYEIRMENDGQTALTVRRSQPPSE